LTDQLTTELYFHGPSVQALEALAADLAELGAIVPHPPLPPSHPGLDRWFCCHPDGRPEDGGYLVCYGPDATAAAFDAFAAACEEAADAHGCSVDGYGTYVGPIELLQED
jgi:hypothetical protein